jgi:hypothetical protein
VVFVGLAETAVALGRGVFEAWCARAGRDDAVFVQSTRVSTAGPVAFAFEEPHSHASRHLVWESPDPEVRAHLAAARTLVVVDDEASTGTTLGNLATAWRARFPAVRSVVAVVLADWRAERGDDVPFVSLLQGSYRFVPGPPPPAAPSALSRDTPADAWVPSGGARTGVAPGRTRLPTLPPAREGERILVLGTGEFTWEPMCVGRALAARGAVVGCQSLSRSPALVEADLRSCLVFKDNYGDGIPHYVYNVRSAGDSGSAGGVAWDRVIVCHETPRHTLDPSLVERLGAELLSLTECATLSTSSSTAL